MSRMRWGALIICCPVDTFGLLGLLFPDCFLAPVLGIVVIPASSCILANTASLNDVPSLSSRVFRNDSSSPRRMLLRLLDGQELAILPRRIRLKPASLRANRDFGSHLQSLDINHLQTGWR